MPDVIDIIAPSGKVNPESLPRLAEALSRLGFTARIPPEMLGEDLLSAHSDGIRLRLLKEALYAEDSAFIWAVRGGCGATRLLPGLKDLAPPKRKKHLMGFSDITALHLFLTQAWGWETVHGPSARQIAEPEELDAQSLALTIAWLNNRKLPFAYPLTPLNPAAEHAEIDGVLTGGNLKLTECSLGTFWQIQSDNKILLLEDLNELAYRIDRSLVHLNQAGVFDHAQALIFGDFTFESNAKEVAQNERVLKRFAMELKIPVFRGVFFGHGTINSPWRYAPATIQAGCLRQ